MRKSIAKKKQTSDITYSSFDQINGQHPLKDSVPESFVEYKARNRKSGKIYYFNYSLAKEVGLISKDHLEKMNINLEKKILETFNLLIINEYDEIFKTKFSKDTIRDHTYMATRYLQSQHPGKQGKTSGDGRSVWNGQISYKGKIWDISSCGTGATCLSPACVKKNKYFKTGDPTISYGCGCSEKDEGLSSAFFSEIMHLNHIKTERILAIIEHRSGLSINIRLHENLLRPSHFFAPLKQNNYTYLNNLYEYYVKRIKKHKEWSDFPSDKKKGYSFFLQRIVEIFARMTASFEDEYIFCWLDWDGDNILMDGSIVDYGSVRQFGMFHHEYRYDDIDRYSTSIVEQKKKARHIVQTFAQIVDFLKTKKRKNLHDFSDHKCLKKFDTLFEYYKDLNLLKKIGFKECYVNLLIENKRIDVQQFRKVFSYFERAKSKRGLKKVADGITWDAIFCMRDILREYPQIMLTREKNLSYEEFINIIKSSYAKNKDLIFNDYRKKMVIEYQKLYLNLINYVAKLSEKDRNKVLLEITTRSSVINKYDRVTGDAITEVVHYIMNKSIKIDSDEIYNVLSDFIYFQNHDPENINKMKRHRGQKNKVIKDLLKIVRFHREGL